MYVYTLNDSTIGPASFAHEVKMSYIDKSDSEWKDDII